jgi:retron-type reverse transcriptase
VSGVDGVGFDAIEALGVEQRLGTLREELRSRAYAPQPLLRVWIPKRNGGQRPLGIPTVKDRVVQGAVVLVLGAIFEADLLPQQYGLRPKADAKMAVRRAYFHITQHNRREVVDADLSDYFTTIPHGPLMRCLSRRIADGQVLSVIKRWLTAPVCERIGRELVRTTEARAGLGFSDTPISGGTAVNSDSGRSSSDETTPTKPFPGLQGAGSPRGPERRQDVG